MRKTYASGAIILLLFFAVAFLFWNIRETVTKIKENQKGKLELWKKSTKAIIKSENPVEISFIFKEIIETIDFPVILADNQGTPITYKNIDIELLSSKTDTIEFLKNAAHEMDKKYSPIKIKLDNSTLQFIHYGDSKYVRRLKQIPILMVITLSFYIIISYVIFQILRKQEQEQLWVGIAKETAHQLGTPISSLSGWVELIKFKKSISKEEITMISKHMEEDINRLELVVTRFSQIGQKEKFNSENIYEILLTVINYYRKRAPQFGKKVKISLVSENPIYIKISKPLIAWVFENLIKNALDAMDKDEGSILIRVNDHPKNISIQVEDNGKGISSKDKKYIFKPGYTTKTRGWGLGLSLVGRIIKKYHRGHIHVKNTESGKGTTIEVLIPKSLG